MEFEIGDPALKKKLWRFSIATTVFFLVAILTMWAITEQIYKAAPNQLTHPSDVLPYLKDYKRHYPITTYGEPTLIPTGIYIQSLQFLNPNTTVATGYIWQKYSKEMLKKGIRPGYNFPESTVPSETVPAYDIDFDTFRLVGWRFSGIPFFEQFDYRKYPFDYQIIWIRIWARDFFKNVILIPDFAGYPSMQPYDIFGIENHDPAIREFTVEETFFDYEVEKVNTNFGMANYVGSQHFPDLYFNIVIKRKFGHSFILYILPVMVIWMLLFAVVMTITSDTELARRFQFSATANLAVLGATFFSVLIAQINLRERFAGHPIIYIEYFYFITYAIIFFLAINSYVTSPGRTIPHMFQWQQNLLPKILFWPIITGYIAIVTLYTFFLQHSPLY